MTDPWTLGIIRIYQNYIFYNRLGLCLPKSNTTDVRTSPRQIPEKNTMQQNSSQSPVSFGQRLHSAAVLATVGNQPGDEGKK